VRRGQVRDYVVGSRQVRVLVISSDNYPYPAPWGLLVSPPRSDHETPGRLLVRLRPDDPRAGEEVSIPAVLRIDESAVRTDCGFITNETMNDVERGLRAFLELS